MNNGQKYAVEACKISGNDKTLISTYSRRKKGDREI